MEKENCLGAFPLPVLYGFHLFHAALPLKIIQHAATTWTCNKYCQAISLSVFIVTFFNVLRPIPYVTFSEWTSIPAKATWNRLKLQSLRNFVILVSCKWDKTEERYTPKLCAKARAKKRRPGETSGIMELSSGKVSDICYRAWFACPTSPLRCSSALKFCLSFRCRTGSAACKHKMSTKGPTIND